METLQTKFKPSWATAVEGVPAIASERSEDYLFGFMEQVIAGLRAVGKVRTSETYTTTLRSLKRFFNNRDIHLESLNSDRMMEYEAYLKANGVSPNTSSFYMRNLRAVYNRAVENNFTKQRFPFKHVYTGVDKTVKRAVSAKTIRQIKRMDLSGSPTLDFARDMFLFSFYTRGMSFVDMAYLRKKDLSNGILSYYRRKTGQKLTIRWERCMQELLDKYDTGYSDYLLPIIYPQSQINVRNQYLYASHKVNQALKVIGDKLKLSHPLTMYVSRHSWASIARSMNVPLSVISEGMGHDSEATTRIYLASLSTAAIDRANLKILKLL